MCKASQALEQPYTKKDVTTYNPDLYSGGCLGIMFKITDFPICDLLFKLRTCVCLIADK